MSIPEHLLDAYRQTDYRVRLTAGGYATIHIDQPLPAALRPLVPDDTPWAFITACNPFSTPVDRTTNRDMQRQLLRTLHDTHGARSIRPGCGVGKDGWREPSLFVVGLDTDALDRLIERFDQHAAVAGHGHDRARLHWHTKPQSTP